MAKWSISNENTSVRFRYDTDGDFIEVMLFLANGERRFFVFAPTYFRYGKYVNGSWSTIREI